MMGKVKGTLMLILIFWVSHIYAQDSDYKLLADIQYYPEESAQSDTYIKERCVLDFYFPTNVDKFPTVVWFHGGGLTRGSKSIADALREKGIGVIAANYRLYPNIKSPTYIEDAAAAVAWAFQHVEHYGGNKELIFVSGHSAGGYLASMVGLDKKWLAKHAIDANEIAGLIPFSGHTITHFTVREERGIIGTQPIIDDLAPLYHVRPDAPPLLLITGDREKELLGRYEENAYMMRMMKEAGHSKTTLIELDGYGHDITYPAYPLLLQEVRRVTNVKRRPNIIFVVADDASWEHFGAYGNAQVRTPIIDRLAHEGVVFENAFVSTASCTSSRASILTGRNGFELEEGATLWGYLPAKFPTYTDLLRQNGYRVGATGKGWAPGFLIDREVNPAGQPYNEIKYNPYSSEFEKSPVSEIDYASNFRSFIKTTDQKQPFCFWMGTFEPHRGFTEGFAKARGIDCSKVTVPGFMPDTEEVRNDICEYLAEIEHLDDQVGSLMKVLEDFDQIDNTLIVFTSDNGMPFPRAKATNYDYGIRMPLIAWWGDNIKGNRRITDLISLTDVAPTFLEAAGVDIPWELSGSSFLEHLKSERNGLIDKSRNQVVTYRERHGFYPNSGGLTYPSRAIRTNDYLLIWNMFPDRIPSDVDGGPTKSFMDDNASEYAKLWELSFGKRPEFELYDIREDPYQMNNLAGRNKSQSKLDELLADLKAYLTDRKDPRMSNMEKAFVHNPYFGIAFMEGLLTWSPEEQGQNLSFEERRAILEKAYQMIGEEDFYKEMIKLQKEKL